MTDRREDLLKASSSLREISMSLQALNDPSDHVLPVAVRSLLEVIDTIELVSSLIGNPEAPGSTAGEYLRRRRMSADLSVEDLALRMSTEPELPLLRRIDWIREIESGVTPISVRNAAAYLRGVSLDLKALGHAVELIRTQGDATASAGSVAPFEMALVAEYVP